MAGKSYLPDVAQILRHIDQGMSHQEIGDLYGTSRQAVGRRLKGATAPRFPNRRQWPWEVETRHKDSWLYRALTYYVLARTKERPLRPREISTLSGFMQMMENQTEDRVVDYWPGTAHGFYLRERDPSRDDPDSLIGTPAPRARTA